MAFERREFLKGGLALSAAAVVTPRIGRAAETGYIFDPKPGAWRKFEVTTQIDILTPKGVTQAWIPLPAVTEHDWIRPLGNQWTLSNGTAREVQVGRYATKMLHVRWVDNDAAPAIRIVSRVATRDRSTDFAKPGKPRPLSAAERTLFLAPTKLIPTDGIVKKTANKIVGSARTDEEKARRIYEWVVVNTVRNPRTRGCGIGDVASMLRTGDLSGKCADLNALYVGLARASGIPARDLYGIRVAPSRFGYKSLGANTPDITKAQHCRAEIYLSDWGWVPVDPADVRKVMLEEPPGHLPLSNPKVEAARKTLFGAWETNWIAYNWGQDVVLPEANRSPIGFLMYPQAETAGEMRNCLDAETFRYAITAKEVA